MICWGQVNADVTSFICSRGRGQAVWVRIHILVPVHLPYKSDDSTKQKNGGVLQKNYIKICLWHYFILKSLSFFYMKEPLWSKTCASVWNAIQVAAMKKLIPYHHSIYIL